MAETADAAPCTTTVQGVVWSTVRPSAWTEASAAVRDPAEGMPAANRDRRSGRDSPFAVASSSRRADVGVLSTSVAEVAPERIAGPAATAAAGRAPVSARAEASRTGVSRYVVRALAVRLVRIKSCTSPR